MQNFGFDWYNWQKLRPVGLTISVLSLTSLIIFVSQIKLTEKYWPDQNKMFLFPSALGCLKKLWEIKFHDNVGWEHILTFAWTTGGINFGGVDVRMRSTPKCSVARFCKGHVASTQRMHMWERVRAHRSPQWTQCGAMIYAEQRQRLGSLAVISERSWGGCCFNATHASSRCMPVICMQIRSSD